MKWQWLAGFASALFSVANPVGNAGIFAAMSDGRSAREATRIAWTCALAVLVILVVAVWFGGAAMKAVGVNVAELRTAGGVIVLIIGLRMLFNDKAHAQTHVEAGAAEDRESIAVVPLAIPIVGGPGAIALVVATAEENPLFRDRVAMTLVCLAMAVAVGATFALARQIARVLGTNGMAVVTRLMGMVLAAIAMGMFAAGLRGLLPEVFG